MMAIRYRELYTCIGQKVTIHSLETIASDVQHHLDCDLPSDLHLQGEARFWRGQLAKYALLDLRFETHAAVDEQSFLSGESVLDHLNFNQPIPKDAMTIAFIRDLRDDIAQDIAQNCWYFLLFLRTEHHVPKDAPDRMAKIVAAVNRLPEDYFPREFTVEDACLTNTHFAWFNRHFYF